MIYCPTCGSELPQIGAPHECWTPDGNHIPAQTCMLGEPGNAQHWLDKHKTDTEKPK